MRPKLRLVQAVKDIDNVPGTDRSVQQSHRCMRHLQERPDSPADELLPAVAPDGERAHNSLVRICQRTEESHYQREAGRTQRPVLVPEPSILSQTPPVTVARTVRII